MFSVDMLTDNSLELDNPAFNLLKLKVTPTDYAAPVACTDYNMDQNQEGCEDDPNCCWNAALCWDLDSGECDAGPALDVFITELADPNNASSARFVELFNIGGEDIDLGSGWALQRWTNGNADPQDPVALTGTISAGGFYVISPNGTAFESMYGVEADQDIDTGGAADSNGDDNIALVDPDGNIADMYGRPGEDGTGTDHEFEDGRAERNSDIAGGNATFDPAEWAIDNDGGGGDGPQDAPDGFDPFVWFDHNGLPTGNWGCLDPEALNYDSDSDGCEDGTEDCCDYPTLATISEIQGQADASPFAGEYVETSGIVTAVASGAYWIQDGSGAWNGIYVYDATDTLVSVGDDITIVALVTEYYDLTELLDLEEFTVNSSGNALPEAVSLGTGAVNAEDYESVLVATAGTCDNADLGYGEWSIDDGSGSVVLDDMMFAFVPIDGNDYEVAGPVYYGYGAYKIQPRDENDVVGEGATATVDLTFNLDMSDVETSADGVFLAGGGTFGNPGDNPMSDEDGDDVWTITMTLPANLSTDYTFLNGNCPDWSCKESIGGQDCAVPPYNDRHIDLGEEDVTVNACFAVCGDGTCDELTPPTTYSANFSIDMNASDYPNADYPSVVINGSWNGWGAWGVELSDSDEDGVFTGTLEGLADNNTVEFVIAVTGEADGWSGWGVVFNAPIGGDCWNGNDEYANYIFTVSGADVDLAYCAGTCDATCEAPPAGDPNFSATISANGGGEDGYDLTFGFSPDATDGYDDGIDSYAPPAPPPPAFDAALTWGGDRYYTQILNGSVDDLVEHEYAIALAYDTNNLIELSWDNTGWSDLMSSCVLQDAFGGTMINVDMLSETSLTLDNPAFNSLLLKVTPSAPEPPPPSLDFAVALAVAGEGNTYTMTAGFSPDATDGYDDGLDTYAPPAPPPPAFDAALSWDGDRYYTQILAGHAEDAGVEHVFDVQLQYGTDNLIALTWDNTGWSDLGTFSLTDAFDGVLGIDIDMTQETSLTLDNPAFNVLKLKITPAGEAGPPPFDDISLAGGWNLISFDVGIENNAPADVFAALIDGGNLVVVTGYGAGGANFYDPTVPDFLNTLTSIDDGFGYWVKVNNEATLSAEGVSLGDGFAKDLAAGWNLIGYWLANSQGPADAFAALIDAGNLVVATGYGAGGANFYDPTVPDFLNTLTSLDNGFGYWVKVNSAVDGFTYPAAGLARPIASVPQETNPEIVKTNEFMFINGEVNFIDMDYTVGDKVEIRTESGLLVGEMKIISVTYEMLDELDDFSGFECSLGDNLLMTAPIYGDDWTTEEIDGAIKGENLRFIYNDNEAELTIEYTGTMELAKVDLEFRFIPDAYALRQNYPNPFNPVTTITYDLADAGFVSLKVYNMLGQEVINLVSADRKAGVYTVQWNGTGHTGHPVSSGVYFYVLNADQFTSVKKMVFMK